MPNNAKISAVELRFLATPEKGAVSALLWRPEKAKCLLVFGHGAGAGMRHEMMEMLCQALAAEGVATFRYQFPYMERGRGGMDSETVRLATVRSAVAAAAAAAPDLPLLAGGKSMGGRMTSLAAAETPLPEVRGLVFVGFPFHPAGKPDTKRAGHLKRVTIPMLFLQGTRDKLADLALLRPICDQLGERACLHVVDTADHSFKVLKRSGKTLAQVQADLGQAIAIWAAGLKD